jgi:hypothetical protein
MRTPAYFFPAHVYVCAIQDQGFFLDLKRNDYLPVPLCELQSLSSSRLACGAVALRCFEGGAGCEILPVRTVSLFHDASH